MTRVKDNIIKNNVIDELVWDSRIDTSNIDVEVKDQFVVLRGTVKSLYSKRLVSENVKSLKNIKSVRNKLQVELDGEEDVPGDAQIQDIIKSVVNSNKYLRNEKLIIKVNEGNVVVKGEVDLLWKKKYFEELISNIYGVISIENKIEVKPVIDLSDNDIKQDIIESLKRRNLDKSIDLDFEIENKTIEINSNQGFWGNEMIILDIIENTNGVKDIEIN